VVARLSINDSSRTAAAATRGSQDILMLTRLRFLLLASEARLTHSDPSERGWRYTACGEPEPGHLDVHGYIAHLQETIDRLQASRYSAGDTLDG
jgi:hypothetical protein